MKNQVRIGIDARLAFQTGVGVYTRNLLAELAPIAPANWAMYVYILEEEKEKLQLPKRYIIRTTKAKWHTVSEQTTFASQLQHDKLDLVHFTYFSYPVAYRGSFISTVHDMTPVYFRTGRASTKSWLEYQAKYLLFRFVFHTQLHSAKDLITPTFTVQEQLIDFAGETLRKKLHVIYEGVDTQLKTTRSNESLAKEYSRPFFLYCGNCYPHKNVDSLIRAFATIDTAYRLVILSPQDQFTKQIVTYLKEKQLEEKIQVVSSANIADRVFFYRHAKALVHPSRSEGFGLPIVEAMYFGLPIIASDIPIFHELMGNEYIAFEPTDIQSIADAIHSFLNHPRHFQYQEKLKQFSFAKMAKETLTVYQAVIDAL